VGEAREEGEENGEPETKVTAEFLDVVDLAQGTSVVSGAKKHSSGIWLRLLALMRSDAGYFVLSGCALHPPRAVQPEVAHCFGAIVILAPLEHGGHKVGTRTQRITLNHCRILSIASAVVSVRAAAAIGSTFDALSNGAAIGPAVQKLLMLYLGRASLAFTSNTLLSMGINNLSIRLQAMVFESVLYQDLAFFGDAQQTGQITRQITEDTKDACAALKHLFQNGIHATAGIVGGAYALYQLSPQLSLLLFASVPISSVCFDAFAKWVRRYSLRAQESSTRAAALVAEGIGNIKTVQAFTAERVEAKRFRLEARATLQLRHTLGMLRALFFETIGLSLSTLTAVIMWYH
jgi:ABC-type multidrug transport system fused ATPase/permease subunit